MFDTIRGWFAEAPHFEGTIIASERIGSRIQKVTIRLPDDIPGPLPLGSYVVAYTWGCVPRAYSIATTDSRSFTLLVSFSGGGVGSRFFRDAKKGSNIIFYGPFDDFPYYAGTGLPKIFFATSTGVAPFRMMVEETIKEKVPAILLLGSPKESDIAFKRDFEELSRIHPSFNFFPVLSNSEPEWSGAKGYVTDYIAKHPELVRKSDVYICGVPPMTISVLAALREIGMPKDHIFVQKFG